MPLGLVVLRRVQGLGPDFTVRFRLPGLDTTYSLHGSSFLNFWLTKIPIIGS